MKIKKYIAVNWLPYLVLSYLIVNNRVEVYFCHVWKRKHILLILIPYFSSEYMTVPNPVMLNVLYYYSFTLHHQCEKLLFTITHMQFFSSEEYIIQKCQI